MTHCPKTSPERQLEYGQHRPEGEVHPHFEANDHPWLSQELDHATEVFHVLIVGVIQTRGVNDDTLGDPIPGPFTGCTSGYF